jgi:hypothetical protein
VDYGGQGFDRWIAVVCVELVLKEIQGLGIRSLFDYLSRDELGK